LSRVYSQFFGGNPINIHCLSADASHAIASGLNQAFPETQIITDIEHVRAGPTKKWCDKITDGKSMQTRITYWLHLLYHCRTYVNYCNAFSVVMTQLRQLGEEDFCEFLEGRYGPNGTHPWNMLYNSSNRLGFVTEQQQIESYYGLIKPNTKLGRIGALKMDVGYKYLTQEGFQSLLKFDANLISQLEVGRIRQETLDSIQSVVPEFLILALLMDSSRDIYPVTMEGQDNVAQDFIAVEGFLCNGPKFIGATIDNSHVDSYIMESTVMRPANLYRWVLGYQ
jgi:hypothetical protein